MAASEDRLVGLSVRDRLYNGIEGARDHPKNTRNDRAEPAREWPSHVSGRATFYLCTSPSCSHSKGTAPSSRRVVGMGTSTRWEGPGGRSGMAAEWSRISGRLSRWNSERPQAKQRLDEIFDDHSDVLHRTMREDQSAFGLVEAVTEAGYRLAAVLAVMAEKKPDGVEETNVPGGHEGDEWGS
jgi:hypothetical protein